MHTHIWFRLTFGSWPIIAIITLAMMITANAPRAHMFAPIDAPDPLEGISVTESLTDHDVAYLRDSLKFLRGYAADWYDYIAQAKPLRLSIDLAKGARGLAATSKCCDEHGYGAITFGDHLGDLVIDVEDQTIQTRRINFLSTLIHEVTHIRDWRAGRMPSRIDMVACLQSERAAFTREVEFKRALISAMPSILVLNDHQRVTLEKRINIEANSLAGNAVMLYCLPIAPGDSE